LDRESDISKREREIAREMKKNEIDEK